MKRTHCRRGHELTDANSYLYKNSIRCKICNSENTAKWREGRQVGYANSRKTECPKGHPYDQENTRYWQGKRICKACAKVNADWQRLKRYGISKDDYAALLEQQSNCCAVCQREFDRTPHIDHDHETGRVRGLLCYPCNSGLGQFQDDTEVLKKAIAYLENC